MNILKAILLLFCAVVSVNFASAGTVLKHSNCAVLVSNTLADWQVEVLEQKNYEIISMDANQAHQASVWSGLRARFPQGLLALEFDTFGAVACVPGSAPGSVQSAAACSDRNAYVYVQNNRGRLTHYRFDAQYRRFRQDLELLNTYDGTSSTVGRIEVIQENAGTATTQSRAQSAAVRRATLRRNLFKNSFVSALPSCSVE